MSSSTNIIFGLVVVAIGLSALFFRRYPGQQMSYESASKKYITANERKISIYDGIYCLIFGVIYMVPGSLPLVFLALFLIAYYPLKMTLLKLKLL